jgi:hypothetical protein
MTATVPQQRDALTKALEQQLWDGIQDLQRAHRQVQGGYAFDPLVLGQQLTERLVGLVHLTGGLAVLHRLGDEGPRLKRVEPGVAG